MTLSGEAERREPPVVVAGRDDVAEAILDFRRGGDRERSFQVLFETYCRPLRRFFRRRGLGDQDALDLTQETFLRIYEGLEGFRGESRFETWIYRIATTTHLKRLRAGRAAMRVGEELDADDLIGSPAELRVPQTQLAGVLRKERRQALDRAIEALPEQMRRALLLRVHRQLRYREIAVVMRISIETVKAHLFQARKRLATTLGDDLTLDLDDVR